jgi:hypothetical protein
MYPGYSTPFFQPRKMNPAVEKNNPNISPTQAM